jgi:hypothetical protein
MLDCLGRLFRRRFTGDKPWSEGGALSTVLIPVITDGKLDREIVGMLKVSDDEMDMQRRENAS